MLIFDKKREDFQIVGYKQFDSEMPLIARFLNNGVPINLSDYYIRFECRKPDGNIVIDDESVVVKNTSDVEMLFNEQVTVVNGKLKCQFVLVRKDNERQDSTFTFEIDVQQSVIGINGYSSSTITIAERLHKDIPIARKLDEDLIKDIETGNQVKDELIKKTDVGNTTISNLIEKTTAGNKTINTLITKTNEGDNTVSNLIEKTTAGDVTVNALIEKTRLGDTTNTNLIQSTSNAKNKDDELKRDIATGNSTIQSLTDKTNSGNLTVEQLTSKNELANQTKLSLSEVTDEAIEKNTILIESNSEANETTIKLQSTLDEAKDDIDKIKATGNRSISLGASQFVNNQYTWKHDMSSQELHVSFFDIDTNEPLLPICRLIDKNNILIQNSDEHPNVKVILSASYFQGSVLVEVGVEEFLLSSIGTGGTLVRLKNNGEYKYPVAKADGVFMSDGSTTLTDKIKSIDDVIKQEIEKVSNKYASEILSLNTYIEELKNSMPSSAIKNFAKFNKNNVKKGYVINLGSGGALTNLGGSNNAVIDESLPIDPDCKYEVLVYQAEEIFISEFAKGIFTRQTRLASGYRWVYNSTGSLAEYGSTTTYSSQSAFSVFETKNNTDSIKISFGFTDYLTSPIYYPNSNTLALDNAINSIKIVKVSKKS